MATISRIVNTKGSDAIKLIGYNSKWREIRIFSAAFFAGNYVYDSSAFCHHFGQNERRVHIQKSTFGNRSLDEYIHAKYGLSSQAKLHKKRLEIINKWGHGNAFRRRGIISKPNESLPIEAAYEAPKLKANDIVFVPGATWNFNDYLNFLESASMEGVRVVQFIHDLIPLVVPEHVVDDVPQQFSRWLKQMSRVASGFLANSNATKSDLEKFFTVYGIPPKPCDVIPLAMEFVKGEVRPEDVQTPIFLDPSKDSKSRIHARVYNAARLPFALCVGTIESRKNVWTLAQVWLSIIEELGGDAPRLVFAGKHGWLKEDFDDLIKGSGSGNGRILVVERPDDHELEYLYKRCMFSIFISYYEGWGLPIGESLSLGKPVVASNTSSMTEVGGVLADYVDPSDFHDIRAKILRLCIDDEYRSGRADQISSAQLRSWENVADDIWENLTRLSKQISGESNVIAI